MPANLPWEQADLTHPASALAMGGPGASRAPTAGRCRTTTCRPRWCCRWAASARPSSPSTISRSICKWNQSLMYSLTAAYYATRLDGAPAMQRGSANIPKLSFEEIPRAAAAAAKARLRRRPHRRRARPQEPQRHPRYADQARPARRFLADRRTDATIARRTVRFRQSSVARNRYRALFKTPQRE